MWPSGLKRLNQEEGSMETLGLLLGVLAGLTQLFGYFLYNREVFRAGIKPNAGSWAVWAFGSFLNYLSYSEMSGDITKDILPFCCASACVTTFVIHYQKGNFGKVERLDRMVFVVDVAICLVWLKIGSATIANLLYQLSTVISFIPMIKSTWEKPEREKPTPWFVWSLAYALGLCAVYATWQKWEDAVYPMFCLILHLCVGVLSLRNVGGHFMQRVNPIAATRKD